MTRRHGLTVALLLLLPIACGGGSSPSEPVEPRSAVFRIQACGGERFDVRLDDPATIAEAEALLGAGNRRIVNGRLARGDGGFNAPWSWHLVSSTVDFVDVAIELCDGCPSHVEDHLDYWVDTVGRYCPWSTEVVARVR